MRNVSPRLIGRMFVLIVLAWGRLLFGAKNTYLHDSLNRVIQVQYGNGTTIKYTYDAARKRTCKVIHSIVPGPVMINIAKVTDAAR